MGSIKALTMAGVVAFGAIGQAAAADLLPPPPMVEAPFVSSPDYSGWYLRADVGVGVNQISGFRSSLQPTNSLGGAAPATFNAYKEIGDSAIVGVGVGYQINNWFRADLTAEYRSSAAYRAGMGYTAFCAAAFCLDTYTANVSSGVFLANGYVDLGTWAGITPYVGAGVGFVRHNWNALTDTGAGQGFAQNKSQNNLAWALMAGVAYSVTPNLKLDLNYRYLDMGRLKSNPITCGDIASCFYETHSYKQTAQDFRIGLRYMIGGEVGAGPVIAQNAPIFGGPAIASRPGPLVRKY